MDNEYSTYIVSYSLDHAIEEAVREFGGRDRVRDTRTHTREQPEHPRTWRGGGVGAHLIPACCMGTVDMHSHTHV